MRSLSLALMLGAGCAQDPTSATTESMNEPTNHTVPESSSASLPDRDPALAKRLVEDEGAVLLDVRTPEEYAQGNLEGSVNIPHDQIEATNEDRMAEIEALTDGEKDTAIVVYCRSGGRASKAKSALEAAGYTRVTNVGGMTDYPTD